MKLYYTPGACSQAPHIVLREAGLPFDLVQVDLAAKRTETGEDYLTINPKGAVPALGLDDGSVLTENAVILQYLADQAPAAGLIPVGGIERYRLLEWVNFIATELHKGYGPLWNPATPADFKQTTRELLGKKFDYLQDALRDRAYVTGETFTIADAYAFVVLNWTGMHDIDLSRWPGLVAFVARVFQRPAVRATLEAEGLLRRDAAERTSAEQETA
jgi:glutathione S-transferase